MGMPQRILLRPWVLSLGSLTLGLIGFQSFVAYSHPVVRADIQQPLFVVRDLDASKELNAGGDVVCWGRIPMGIYSGERAFSSSADALEYLQRRGMLSKGFAVYQLSGDFVKDTYQVGERHFTQRTLRVTDCVAPLFAQHSQTVR